MIMITTILFDLDGTFVDFLNYLQITTVSLYVMMAIHLLWYDIPFPISLLLAGVCIGIMLMSFILYTIRNVTAIRKGTLSNPC